MAANFGVANNFLSASVVTVPAYAYPLSAGMWAKPNQTTVFQCLLEIADASSINEFQIIQGNNALSNGTSFVGFVENSTNSSVSPSCGTATIGRYVYVVVRWLSATNRWIHVFDPVANTVSSSQDTTNIAVPTGITNVTFGNVFVNGQAFSGTMAEAWIANGDCFPASQAAAPPNDQVMQLAFNGPLACPGLMPIVSTYWPMNAPVAAAANPTLAVPDYAVRQSVAPLYNAGGVTFTAPHPPLVTQWSQQIMREVLQTRQTQIFDLFQSGVSAPMPPGTNVYASPVLAKSLGQAIRAQSEQRSTAIYQTPPLPIGATSLALPVRTASPWQAIRAQADQVSNTINQPAPAVALPPGQPALFVPFRLSTWVALNSQSWVQGAVTVYQTPQLPPAAQAIALPPRALSPWSAINAQANLESLAIYITPATPQALPPGQSVLYVPPGLSRWAAINAMANLEANFLPLIPVAPIVPVQPFQGAGNSMGVGRKKKKKKEIIREAVEEAYQRVIAEKPDISSASILKLVATAPEVKMLDNVRLAQIVAALEILAAERDEDDAITLLLLS